MGRFGGIGVGLVGAEEGKRAEKINVIGKGASGSAPARALESFDDGGGVNVVG